MQAPGSEVLREGIAWEAQVLELQSLVPQEPPLTIKKSSRSIGLRFVAMSGSLPTTFFTAPCHLQVTEPVIKAFPLPEGCELGTGFWLTLDLSSRVQVI